MSTISKHLAVLRDAGVVTRRKQGVNIYYSLALECENYCISRRAMRCETGALIECHKHEFHCVVAYHINVRDTAILI